jgi:hypothetical protein
MPEIDFTTFQSLNMAIAAGISVFAVIYIMGKLLFTWPALDDRLNNVRSHYNLFDSSYLQESLHNQFWQTRKK